MFRLVPALCLSAALAFPVSPAFAINWEGHDNWELPPEQLHELLRQVPPPLRKPLPPCSHQEERAAANSYEQVPIPGRSCWEDRLPPLAPASP